MAKRRSPRNEEGGLLFDLPLHSDTEPEFDEVLGGGDGADAGVDTFRESTRESTRESPRKPSRESSRESAEGVAEMGFEQGSAAQVVPIQTRLFPEEEDDEDQTGAGDLLDGEDEGVAPLTDRLLGGVSDLAIHAAMLGVAAAGSYVLGVQVSLADWPPLTVLLLIFSFLYWTIPLAFWGQTPGMAWIGNSARSLDDEPLSFGQAIMRWVGALLTLGLAGLPMLLSLGGRSLSDWMSESKTVLV